MLDGPADRAVALQVRHPAAVAHLPRFPDHRSRHLFVPALGIPAAEDCRCSWPRIAAVPVLWLIWRTDPFRVSRNSRWRCLPFATLSIAAMAVAVPEQPWEPFQGINHISNLARSGVVAVSRLTSTGWIEADPPSQPRAAAGARRARRRPAALPLPADCDTTVKRPHIIMLLDEFELRCHGGARHQGAARATPTSSSPSTASSAPWWRRRPAVRPGTPSSTSLTGLSARSFGDLKFYVTRIAAGRVTRGLPLRCSAAATRPSRSIRPMATSSARAPSRRRVGVEQFIDMADMGVNEDMQPDSFYFDQALEGVCARAAVARAGLHVRVSHRQSFPLDRRLPARSDAGLDAAGQHARRSTNTSAGKP